MARTDITVSVTETRQYRRLVQFLMDVESLASVNADDELREIVNECRVDLLGPASD